MALRYLLTGLPRIRSAWFAALLSTDEVPCYHGIEDPTGISGPFGLSDPGACLLYPDWSKWASAQIPVVIIVRGQSSARPSLERWTGLPIPQVGWDALVTQYDAFIDDPPYRTEYFPYECLDDYAVVSQIHQHLTGRPLSRARFDIFNGLKIEQHLDKARRAGNTAP